MNQNFEEMFQESESEWADIDRLIAERKKKDNKIISLYCSQNKMADIVHIIRLLQKHEGMASHDKTTVQNFKDCYPDKLTVQLLHAFLDVKDIYQEYLESGGEFDD